MRRLTLLLSLLIALVATAATAADRAIIVLDGSGSMWAQIDGKARIDIARETLTDVLSGLSPDMELGFMSYGHRSKGDCSDIELMVPPAAGTTDAILASAKSISPRGKTPITEAVRQAAEALGYTEEKATVILVTDGIETCGGDPCQLGIDLEHSGVDFTAHVIGFGLTEAEGQKVACLAENTGGMYLPASGGAGLIEALNSTVAQVDQPSPVAAPPPPAAEPAPSAANFAPVAVMAEGDDPLPQDSAVIWEIYKAQSDGSRGDYVTTEYGNALRTNLDPGSYVVVGKIGFAESSQTVTITADQSATPQFVLNAGTVVVRAYASEGSPPDDSAAATFDLPDGTTTTSYGPATVYLPAGTQHVVVTIGAATVEDTFELAAGDVVNKDIVVGAGHVTVNAFYVPGMRVEDGSLFIEIDEPTKAIDGSRKNVGYGYGPDSGYDLAPGDYVAIATMDQAKVEMPFTVVAGQGGTVDVVLNAGVLAISAPGYDFIEILGKKDIAGNAKDFGYGYGGEKQATLPPGDYTVRAHLPGDAGTKEMPATVTAGERIEITVPLE